MSSDRPKHELSPREKQLLKFSAEGYTDAAIAHKLGISEATVGTYWGRVRIKLGPYSRTELVAIILKAEQEAAVESLRRENEELIHKLESMVDPGASFYRELIENAPDAIVLVSESGVIEMANNSACELFGYQHGELEGSELTRLIPERMRDLHRRHRAEYVTAPLKREMGEHLNTPALHKDGSEFQVRAALSAVETPTGLVVTCVLRAAK